LQEDIEADLYSPAIQTAKDSDIAIVFVGNTSTWETAPRNIRVSKPIAIDEMEREEWFPYTDQGIKWDSALHQKGNVLSAYKNFVDLSEIVSTTVYSFYSNDEQQADLNIMNDEGINFCPPTKKYDHLLIAGLRTKERRSCKHGQKPQASTNCHWGVKPIYSSSASTSSSLLWLIR